MSAHAPARPVGPPVAAQVEASGRRAFGRRVPAILIVVVLVLALPPRLLDTDRFVTTDELFWMGRSGAFARALATGQYAQTFQSGHPGVTTMWAALLGAGPEEIGQLAGSRREVSRREVSEHPRFMELLGAARRGFGAVTGLGIALLALLAWRLFGPWPALLGGVLLALDPFLLAHSRLVHIDASLAIWMAVAVMAGLVRAAGGGPWALATCGAATALALLSKSPALSLLLFVPLALAVPRLSRRPDRLGSLARDLAGWAVLAALGYVALWPAMWAAPGETLGRVLGFVRDNSNPEHAALADEDGSGVLFYPLALLFRATPLMLLGLGGLLLFRPRGVAGRAALVLGLVALLFGAAMTVAAKSFDRYLLPIFPLLDILAGAGLWALVARLVPAGPRAAGHGVARDDERGAAPDDEHPFAGGRGRAIGLRAVAGVALAVLAAGVSGVLVLGTWPYGLTYANPLLGGAPAAHRAIASGWGEGLDRAAAYLNAKPNAERLKVGVPGEIYTTVLGAQLAGQVGPIDRATADPSAWDYVVVYVRNLQAGDRPAFLDGLLLPWGPEHVVTLSGVEYAWIYDARNGVTVGARFGDGLVLDGYGLDAATVRPGRRLEARLRWRAVGPVPPDLSVRFELRPSDGGPPLETAHPLGASEPATRPAGARQTVRYELPTGPSARPGTYTLGVRVTDSSGAALPVTHSMARQDGAADEPGLLTLRTVTVR
jgi:hypothetical protein